MARETQILTADGLTLYQTVRRDSDGYYYNGNTLGFDSPPLTTWSNYVLPLTKTVIVAGVEANYVADFPAVAAGSYSIDVYVQSGASPSAAADGRPQWEADITWNGTITVTAPSPGSHYATVPMLRSLLGAVNEQTDADINSDANAVTIAAQEDAALTEGDIKVNAMLSVENLVAPLSTSSLYPLIQYAAARYSAVALTRSRGQVNAAGKPVEAYAVYVAEADAMMNRVIATMLYGGNVVSAPVAEAVTLYPTARAWCAPVGPWGGY